MTRADHPRVAATRSPRRGARGVPVASRVAPALPSADSGSRLRGWVLAVALFAFMHPAIAAPEIAPPPRPAGQPPPSEAAAVSPAETVDRILTNARAAGDRLARNDAGTATRGTQADILRDIDALLNHKDDPPPKSDPPPPDPKPQGNPPPKSGDEPKAGSGASQPRPKRGGPGSVGRQAPSGGGQPEPKPQPAGGKAGPAATAGGDKPGTPVAPATAVPPDDDVVKDVWGQLPETLRKQVSQYYRQQFMPGYAELLRQYYTSLAEQGRKPTAPPEDRR